MIMKKEYISPSSSIIDIKLSPLMTNSLDPNATGSQTITPDDNEESPSEFTSRRRSEWDEEEEDY